MRTMICVNSYNLFYFPSMEKQGDSTEKYNLFFFFTIKIIRLLTL